MLAALLVVLIRQGAGPQIARATHQATISCEALAAGAQRLASAAPDAAPTALQAVLDLVLRDQPGTEGGYWRADAGVVAYAFPTYDGTGVKRDPPSAELERIGATAQRALASASLVGDVRPGLREAVVFSACPVGAPPTAAAAWTLMRVPLIGADVVNPLILAVSLLLCMVVISGAWLGRMLARWRRQSEALQRQLAQSARLAMLGEVSAGLAHEIRNPLATMRMRVENAMAAPPDLREARVAGALEAVLEQTGRLDGLVASLLALTRPFRVERQPVDLGSFLDQRMQAHATAAEAAGVRLVRSVAPELDALSPAPAWFDPAQMARACDNLLLNALAHTPTGGTIALEARRAESGGLRLSSLTTFSPR